MSKINDNTYINKIQKQIMGGTFEKKEDLIEFLKKNRFNIMNDPFFRQELESSFIKLNDETMEKLEKKLLEFYDKKENKDINSLNLDGVSSFEVDNKEYIKYKDSDGNITVLDDSLTDDHFVEQFKDKQNNLSTANTMDAEINKQEIVKDMAQDKINVNLNSTLEVNKRDLTAEEKRQFAAVIHMPDSENIDFIVDPSKNIYINKDNGDVYFVNKNSDGQLEVRKANEVTSATITSNIDVIDDNKQELNITIESPEDINFEALSDSDLEYIYENKINTFNEQQKTKLLELIQKRRALKEQNLGNEKINNKVFVKKLDNALHTPYNGFISVMFLCCVVGFFGLSFLLLIINNIS